MSALTFFELIAQLNNTMALSPEFTNFHGNWQAKADAYDGSQLQGAFDKFFTQYVIFNRLYAEATFRYIQINHIPLPNYFPDSKGAIEYTLGYIGAQALKTELEADPKSVAAIAQVVLLLSGPIHGRQFNIVLDRLHGNPQPAKDAELLSKLASANPDEKCWAVLKFLYAIRCNTFHGHKGFEPIQLEVLIPANTLLRHVTEILFDKLA
jgi:hypothetical protein